MKEYATRQKKSHVLRFWIVTLLCAAMIGAACWFAYTQTANELSVQLETTIGNIQDMPATNPPYTKSTELPATTAAMAEVVTEPERTDPPETLAAAAKPETVPPETALPTETETESAPPCPRCMPVDGTILQPFSDGSLVKSPTTGVWQTHNGIDIAAALGDAVYATDAGVVTRIEEDALWGITVTIDHRNGDLTRFCGLNAGLGVTEGDAVERGTVIGAVGNSADIESGEPSHLHFEVIRGGSFINPETYLSE